MEGEAPSRCIFRLSEASGSGVAADEFGSGFRVESVKEHPARCLS